MVYGKDLSMETMTSRFTRLGNASGSIVRSTSPIGASKPHRLFNDLMINFAVDTFWKMNSNEDYFERTSFAIFGSVLQNLDARRLEGLPRRQAADQFEPIHT